nr:FAST kinase domain-containing protein 1, mitochondrial isoform X1 [Onthophagus taurus]
MKLSNIFNYSRRTKCLYQHFTSLEVPKLQLIQKRHVFIDGLVTKGGFVTNKLSSINNNNTISNKRYTHDDYEFDFETELKISNEVYEEIYQQPDYERQILYPDLKDELMKQINECASIGAALSIVKNHKDQLMVSHLTQLVVTFWDLQRMYHHVNISRNNAYVDETIFLQMNTDYTNLLFENDVFKEFVMLINDNRSKFNVEQLSYLVYFLNKIGFCIKSEMFQNLIIEFNKKFFTENFSMDNLSRFMSGLYKKDDLSFYYATQQYIPIIYKEIDNIVTVDDLVNINKCLATIAVLVPNEILLKYKKKVYELIIKGHLNHNNYKCIIRTATFLNFPFWKHENLQLLVDCLKLLKGHVHLLNVQELLMVYDVFNKLHEPGDILNELQRTASKYLLQLEEDLSPLLDIRLRLLACVMYFTSPSQRLNIRKTIRKYLDYDLDGCTMLELQKIMLITKSNDLNLCKTIWNKILICLDDENFVKSNLLRVCHSYLNFEEITDNFRHVECERKLLSLLKTEFNEGLIGHTPCYFSSIASFHLIYCRDIEMINKVIDRMEEFKDQFNPIDCINISQSLEYAKEENVLLTKHLVERINNVLDHVTNNFKENANSSESILLLKAAMARENIQNYTDLWKKFDENVSSQTILGLCYCLYTTGTLLPNIMDIMTDYVVKNGMNLLGFNVERILFLCYFLGYIPKNSEKFFEATTNVLIRDQERLGGLSYLQACLALAFFNALPQSFIKQIFNEQFLEKIDIELETCYFKSNFKDTYPLRVRQCMMRLNRSVSLDYPEANVPWFHQKYVQLRNEKRDNDRVYHKTVMDSLFQLANYKDIISSNVTLPYGYRADFVVYLDNKRQLTNVENSTTRVAIFILQPRAYTKGVVQFRGSAQMKIRHLEMLGYKVAIVNLNEWKALIYGEERLEYLNDVLGVKDVDLNTGFLTNR